MVNEKHLFSVKNLVLRNNNRLNPQANPIQLETDELFYFVIDRLVWSMKNCWPAKKSHSVTIKAKDFFEDGSVILSFGKIATYRSEYVKKDEFHIVIENVINIFNEIGKSKENGYHFSAIGIIPKNLSENVEFTVNMTTYA